MQIRYLEEGGDMLDYSGEHFNDNDDDDDTNQLIYYLDICY